MVKCHTRKQILCGLESCKNYSYIEEFNVFWNIRGDPDKNICKIDSVIKKFLVYEVFVQPLGCTPSIFFKSFCLHNSLSCSSFIIVLQAEQAEIHTTHSFILHINLSLCHHDSRIQLLRPFGPYNISLVWSFGQHLCLGGPDSLYMLMCGQKPQWPKATQESRFCVVRRAAKNICISRYSMCFERLVETLIRIPAK